MSHYTATQTIDEMINENSWQQLLTRNLLSMSLFFLYFFPSPPLTFIRHLSPKVTCLAHPTLCMVFAGCLTGELVTWDLRETTATHHQLREEEEEVVRTPTFTSRGPHTSRVTAVRHLQETGQGSEVPVYSEAGRLAAFQLVSVETQARLVVWTVLDSQRDFDTQLGLAHWGRVRMVPSSVIDLASLLASEPPSKEPEVHGHDLALDPEDSTRLYVGADAGMVIHGSTQADHRPSPRLFKPEIETNASCNSIAFCPFGEPYMLLGSQDGSIRLHNSSNERPLITWAGTVDNEPILKVIWSSSRPCVFFILDTASRIHLWDLGAGDIYPAHTVQFGDKVLLVA